MAEDLDVAALKDWARRHVVDQIPGSDPVGLVSCSDAPRWTAAGNRWALSTI